MANMNWQRQTPAKPLFPDLLWSRPENRRQAGKLLIIGGHAQRFIEPSLAYSVAVKAGIGTGRVLLPESLQKTLGRSFHEAIYAMSNKIGSFSRTALASWLDEAEWADAVLLAGDLGHNSETTILIDNFLSKFSGQVILCGDSIDVFLEQPGKLMKRDKTVLVANLQQIQKLAAGEILIKQTDDLMKTLESLSLWLSHYYPLAVTKKGNKIIVVDGGKVSTTSVDKPIQFCEIAAYIAVWQLQQPEKIFESLTSGVFALAEGHRELSEK